MARTNLPKTVPVGGVAAGAVAAVATAADPGNGNSFVPSGKDLLVVRNTDASGHTLTVASVNDAEGRAGSGIAADAIAAGATRIYGPFPTTGWQQTDGTVWVNSDSALVLITVISLP